MFEWNGASHGPWCREKAHPMRCRDCGVDCMWFECSHDCKVLLERVAGRFVRHECRAPDDTPRVWHPPVDKRRRRRPRDA